MSAKYGWEFWLNDNGTIRSFVDGHESEDTAKRVVQSRYPHLTDLNFVSKQLIPWPVIEMLGLSGGEGMEWVPVEPKDTLQPRAYDQGANVPKPKGR